MSKRPYIVQQDSPNLVIVPTDSEGFYEPSPKKVLPSDLPAPTQIYNGVFAKKCAKSKLNGVNNNVLIDVSTVPKPSTSWATNFLQSIGGSSTKFTRVYSTMPKSPCLRTNNNQPENNTDVAVPNTHQAKTNTATTLSIMEENSVPQININLIKPKLKPALPSIFTKEASQPNGNTKPYQSKMDMSTNQAVHKEPTLPKHYKIPMHSKKKPVNQPEMEKGSIMPNSIKDTCQKSQSIVPSSKSNSDIYQLKQKKQTVQETTPNKSTHPKEHKDPHQSMHELIKAKRPETDHKTHEINHFKTNKIKVHRSNENLPNRTKYDKQIILPPSNKETVQLIRNKENSHPKYDKESKQCNIAKQITLPRKYDPCQSKCSKEMTCLNTEEKKSQLINRKDTYKVQNKQESTFSTKLKTKKAHINLKSNKSSKTSKPSGSRHSQENKPKKHKDNTFANEESNLPQTLSKEEDIVRKLKTKRIIEKEAGGTAENSNNKNKKLKSSDANATKKENAKPINEERLSKSVSPIKSVVSKIKSDLQSHNSAKRYHKESGYYHSQFENTARTDFDYVSQKSSHRGSNDDLRTKLKRKFNKIDYCKEDFTRDPSNKKNKFAAVATGDPFVPQENLIISFNTKEDNEEKKSKSKSPVKKNTRKQQSGGNKCKKIKLEINIVFGQADTTDDESINNNADTKEESLENMDLSFLDDFNVDEIVESLNECENGSRKTNNKEELPVAAVTIPSENKKIDSMMRQDNALLNKNEIKVETESSKEIPSMGNKIENQETASPPTVNENRPCHIEEINSGITTIKEESDINPKTELSQKNLSTTSLNNYTEVVDIHTNNGTLLVPKIELSEKAEIITDTKEIKPQIAHSETPVVHLSSTSRIHPDLRDFSDTRLQLEINANKSNTAIMNDNPQAAKENLTTNQPTITQNSNTTQATESAFTLKLNEKSTCIKEECDTITIDDSESENDAEIKNNQSLKDGIKKDLHSSKDSPFDSSDDVIIIEPTIVANSESILILDTDYSIEENGDTKAQSKGSENRNSVEQKKDTDATVNLDKTELKHNSIEIKTNKSDKIMSGSEEASYNRLNNEMKPDLTKPEMQHGKFERDDRSTNVKVPNKPNSDEPSSKKPTETNTVVPEKCSQKKTVVNTKEQNATQIEKKASNRSITQENNEDEDKVTQNNDKVNRNLVKDHFIHKAEEKIFLFMRRKVTITDVIRIGKFSKIYLCKDSLKHEFALKALKSESDGSRPKLKEQFQKEKMLMKLQNGVPENNLNCIRLIKGFVICGLWCFLMEYYPKNLHQVFLENKKSFHIDDVQVLSRQLVSAVTILRNNNIIHSDIKPKHILINAAQTRIKLCGFDQSCHIQNSTLLPNTGTVNYRAPELILGYPAGYGIDVWSTALVMFEMATNRTMFPGMYNNNILFQQLCTLGNIPIDMLTESKFRNKHFKGTAFSRIVGSNGERIIINGITSIGQIDSILFRTYTSEWGRGRSQPSMRADKAKLSSFSKLLHSMLVMHPRYRIAIEFVFANPFIYEFFDNDY